MKLRIGFLLLILSLIPDMWTLASQSVKCQLNLSSAVTALKTAQSAIDKGNTDTALQTVGEARSALQLLEAQCTDYAPDTAGDSRTNPVAFGQRQHAEMGNHFSGSIQLIEYIDDAKGYVKKANSRNESPPEGTRYIVFRLKFACEKSASESCNFSRGYFSTVGDRGLVYGYDSYQKYDIRFRNIGDDAELFGGAEIEVDLAFVVDMTDNNFVLFTDYPDSRVFFASK